MFCSKSVKAKMNGAATLQCPPTAPALTDPEQNMGCSYDLLQWNILFSFITRHSLMNYP